MVKLRTKYEILVALVTTTVIDTKIGEAENKIPDVSVLVKKTDYNANTSDIEENTLLVLIIINLQEKYLMQR